MFVEGRYYETINSWDKAADIYHSLYIMFPDNLDYGLRLLNARRSTGSGREALRLTDELRRLPPPAPDDPRIDVEEAGAAEIVGDYKRELAAAARAATTGAAQGSRILLARARLLEGHAYAALGQPDRAEQSLQESQAIYSQYNHHRGMARALYELAFTKLRQGDTEGARKLHEESLAIFRKIGNQTGIADALHSIAAIRQQQGQFETAKAMYSEAIAIRREIGERGAMVTTLDALSTVLLDLGSLGEAKRIEAEALAIDRATGDKRMVARDLASMALATRYEGDLAGSKSMYQEAIAIRRELADDAGLAAALNGLSRLLHDQGDLAGAKKMAQDALVIDRKQGAKRPLSNSLAQLAVIALTEDDLERAKTYHTESLALRMEIGNRNLQARNRLALAQWNLEEGRPDLAEPLALEAAVAFHEQHSGHLEAVAESVVALSEALQKKSREAQRALERASILQPKIELRQLRLSTGATLARASVIMGKRAEAISSLEALLAEAIQTGLVTQQLEIRLALGQAEMQSADGAKGRARLAALRSDASAKGYRLIARKAEQALKGR
jgi:tetratricopeptide (TPR) repeat protein